MAFGYYAGLAALDAIIAITIEDDLLDVGADFPRTAPPVADARLRQRVRLAIAAMMLPADTPLVQMAELHAQVCRVTSRPRVRSVPDRLPSAADPLPELPVLTVPLPPEDTAASSVA
jgi:hypothetical protein